MKRFIAATVLLALIGCRSVMAPITHLKPDYSALNAESLQQVAQDIEKAVQNGERDAKIVAPEGIVIDDAVRQAIRTRAARSELVNAILDSGHACEKNNGLLYLLRTSAYKKSTSSKQRDRDAFLVDNEATDRWTIYEGIMDASKLPPKSLSAIQETFHAARVACMTPGQKYQDASGAIVAK